MKVIVAGFSKTGTTTMNAALNQLGYKVYDFPEHFWYANKAWCRMLTFGGSLSEIKEVYDDVDAVCDLPACYFWDELIKLYPDAKIILTVRDDEDMWWKSMQTQLSAHNKNLLLRMCYIFSWTGYKFCCFQNKLGPSVFGNPNTFNELIQPHGLDETRAKMLYRRHNANVLQNAPKDQLLVFNVKEGWEPLCKFLGNEVPNLPFPRRNVRGNAVEEQMKNHPLFRKIIREVMISMTFGVGLLALAGYLIFSKYFF